MANGNVFSPQLQFCVKEHFPAPNALLLAIDLDLEDRKYNNPWRDYKLSFIQSKLFRPYYDNICFSITNALTGAKRELTVTRRVWARIE